MFYPFLYFTTALLGVQDTFRREYDTVICCKTIVIVEISADMLNLEIMK